MAFAYRPVSPEFNRLEWNYRTESRDIPHENRHNEEHCISKQMPVSRSVTYSGFRAYKQQEDGCRVYHSIPLSSPVMARILLGEKPELHLVIDCTHDRNAPQGHQYNSELYHLQKLLNERDVEYTVYDGSYGNYMKEHNPSEKRDSTVNRQSIVFKPDGRNVREFLNSEEALAHFPAEVLAEFREAQVQKFMKGRNTAALGSFP